MFGLDPVFALIKLLNSEKGKNAIASGFALGMVLGLLPSNPIMLAALFFIFFILRINGGALFLSWAAFAIVAFPLDPLFDRVGYWLLTDVAFLQPWFTRMYNMPIVPWSAFNNTIMAGSFFIALISFLPVLFLSRFLVQKYRDTVLRRFKDSKVFKFMKATAIYKLYEKYEQAKGAFS